MLHAYDRRRELRRVRHATCSIGSVPVERVTVYVDQLACNRWRIDSSFGRR
jgi:hypothetical protein